MNYREASLTESFGPEADAPARPLLAGFTWLTLKTAAPGPKQTPPSMNASGIRLFRDFKSVVDIDIQVPRG